MSARPAHLPAGRSFLVRRLWMSRSGGSHLEQPSKFVRPVTVVRFIVVDVEAGRPCSHQAPGFADRLGCGRILELHRSATLFSMDLYLMAASWAHDHLPPPGLTPPYFIRRMRCRHFYQ